MTWGIDNLTKNSDSSKLAEYDYHTNTMNSEKKAIYDKPDHELVWFYQEATRRMEQNPEVLEEINQMIADYEKRDEKIAAKVRYNCQKVLDGMKASLRRLDIHFESFAWESKFIFNNSVDEVVENLKGLDCTAYDDSALYLDLEKIGIKGQENKFYLTRSDGSSLYSTRDITYHLDKLANFDRAIVVLGEDHRLKAKVVRIAVGLLGQDMEKKIGRASCRERV